MRLFWRVAEPIIIYTIISFLVLLVVPFSDAVAGTMAAALFTIPVLGYLFYRDQRQRGQTFFHGGISLKMTGYIAVFGIGVCLAVNNLITISRISVLFPGYNEVAAELYSPPLWLQFLAIGIVIPVVEELIFRGLGYARLRDAWSFKKAAVVSSVLFAVYHGNVTQAVFAFVLGMCLCWLYERTGTLLSSVLFHQAANILSITFATVSNYHEAFNTGISLYILTAAALAVLLWSYRQIKKNVQEEVQP